MNSKRLFPERGDFEIRQQTLRFEWPIAPGDLLSVGDGVTPNRGNGQPHHGVDLFANAGTPVLAARAGKVKRIIDGNKEAGSHGKRAGLWIDVEVYGQLDRYLHLGSAVVAVGQKINRGTVIGTVAAKGESGSGQAPHLHFEVRATDWDSVARNYGTPLTPNFVVV